MNIYPLLGKKIQFILFESKGLCNFIAWLVYQQTSIVYFILFF